MAFSLPSLSVLLLLSIVAISDAFELPVGGRDGSWKVPSSPDEYTHWADKLRLLIGDVLVLKYDPKADSVLQVSEENFNSCNRTDPIKSYSDGETKILLDRSGPFFFISGAQGHCESGQKMKLRVLSAKRGTHLPPPVGSPAQPPAGEAPRLGPGMAPAPAPASGSVSINAGIMALVSAVVGVFALI